jgi:hypothetical protein
MHICNTTRTEYAHIQTSRHPSRPPLQAGRWSGALLQAPWWAPALWLGMVWPMPAPGECVCMQLHIRSNTSSFQRKHWLTCSHIIYTYVCICKCICKCICIYIYIYIYTCIYTHIQICTVSSSDLFATFGFDLYCLSQWVWEYIYIYIYIYMHNIYIYIYIYMHTCNAYIYVCMYIYIYTHKIMRKDM